MRQYVISGGEKRPRRLRIGIPICFLTIRLSSNGIALNTDTQHIIFGKGDASMYIIFSAIIRIGVAFFDFHNGIINLLE